MPNQPFNAEEWLNSKKKGISGKVPRADFIAKMKELGAEIENKASLLDQTKKEKQDLAEQSEQKIIEYKKKEEELTTKLAEQAKVLQSKDNQIENLQQRPDITPEKYQQLLNNQEKHSEKDLKPTNLPADWEQQLSDKKIIEKNFADIKEKNLALEKKLSATEEKFLELSAKQKNFLETEAKLTKAEQQPTAEDLQKAVQKEKEKYKDYDNLKTELEKVRKELQSKGNELKENFISKVEFQELNQQLQSESEAKETLNKVDQKEKNRVLAEKLSVLPPPAVQLGKDKETIIKEVEKILNSTINPLRLEIIGLKRQVIDNNSPGNSATEFPTDYKEIKAEKEELLKILKLLGDKIEK